MAWEKTKKWYFKRNGKDRRNPNPHRNLGYELGQLSQAFQIHEKNDDERTKEIKDEIGKLREEQGKRSTAMGILKSKVN